MKKTPLNILVVFVLLYLLIISLFSCTKNTIEEYPEEVTVKSEEIIDMSNNNILSAPLAEWNNSMVVKTTYTNGSVTYVSKSLIDPTKSLVTLQSATGKIDKSIATAYQIPGSTNRFFSLRSVDGKILYYSILMDKYNNVIEVKSDDPRIFGCVWGKLRWLGGNNVGRLLCFSTVFVSMTGCAITAGIFCVFGLR